MNKPNLILVMVTHRPAETLSGVLLLVLGLLIFGDSSEPPSQAFSTVASEFGPFVAAAAITMGCGLLAWSLYQAKGLRD